MPSGLAAAAPWDPAYGRRRAGEGGDPGERDDPADEGRDPGERGNPAERDDPADDGDAILS
jgi:hypothetical protein